MLNRPLYAGCAAAGVGNIIVCGGRFYDPETAENEKDPHARRAAGTGEP